MSNQQIESNKMLFTVNWWRKLLKMVTQQGQEYASIDADNDYASNVMKDMIDKVSRAVDEGTGMDEVTLYFKHADGRAIEIKMSVALCAPDDTFSDD